MTRRYQSGKPNKDTLHDVITEYKLSPKWRNYKPGSIKVWSRAFDQMKELGHRPIADLRRRDFTKIQRALSNAPGLANQFAHCASALLNWALKEEFIEANPCTRLDAIDMGTWKRVPDNVISAVLEPSVKMEPWLRLAIVLAVYSGQRVGDLVAMTWDKVGSLPDGRMTIALVQEKGRKKDDEERVHTVVCPLPLRLALEEERARRPCIGNVPIVRLESGRPASPCHVRNFWRKALIRAQLPHYPWHGLRKSAASRLAEAGASLPQIMAMTGHTDPDMALFYIEQANRVTMATQAADLIDAKGRPLTKTEAV